MKLGDFFPEEFKAQQRAKRQRRAARMALKKTNFLVADLRKAADPREVKFFRHKRMALRNVVTHLWPQLADAPIVTAMGIKTPEALLHQFGDFEAIRHDVAHAARVALPQAKQQLRALEAKAHYSNAHSMEV